MNDIKHFELSINSYQVHILNDEGISNRQHIIQNYLLDDIEVALKYV